jgi:hypothetical protein
MTLRNQQYTPPRHNAIGPVNIECPHCGAALGYQVRLTLESARQAAKRPQLAEAFVVCSSCHRLWVAGLHLSIAALAVSEVAA